jgi:hypothetical protein
MTALFWKLRSNVAFVGVRTVGWLFFLKHFVCSVDAHHAVQWDPFLGHFPWTHPNTMSFLTAGSSINREFGVLNDELLNHLIDKQVRVSCQDHSLAHSLSESLSLPDQRLFKKMLVATDGM